MIPFRPHHVLCAICFHGEGYSDAFLVNMTRIVAGQLRAPGGDETRLRFASSADAICAPCPKRRGAGCATQAKAVRLDADHAAALDISEGAILTWGEIRNRALEAVAPEDLDTLCAGCSWLPMGICKHNLAAAQASTQTKRGCGSSDPQPPKLS